LLILLLSSKKKLGYFLWTNAYKFIITKRFLVHFILKSLKLNSQSKTERFTKVPKVWSRLVRQARIQHIVPTDLFYTALLPPSYAAAVLQYLPFALASQKLCGNKVTVEQVPLARERKGNSKATLEIFGKIFLFILISSFIIGF
jgi:hypothetical protein